MASEVATRLLRWFTGEESFFTLVVLVMAFMVFVLGQVLSGYLQEKGRKAAEEKRRIRPRVALWVLVAAVLVVGVRGWFFLANQRESGDLTPPEVERGTLRSTVAEPGATIANPQEREPQTGGSPNKASNQATLTPLEQEKESEGYADQPGGMSSHELGSGEPSAEGGGQVQGGIVVAIDDGLLDSLVRQHLIQGGETVQLPLSSQDPLDSTALDAAMAGNREALSRVGLPAD